MLRDPQSHILKPDMSQTNFQYKEFIKSNTALRKGIQNIPVEDNWLCIEKLTVNILQPVREKFGRIRISSGFRSPDLCLAVGSSTKSNHCRGQAADFEPLRSNVSLYQVLAWIYRHLEFRELIAEYFPDGWIHVAYREGANDRILKLKDDKHNFDRVELSYIQKLYGV
jgi:zinc D-Ala-D-Ala carboxypeptidase